MGRNYEYHEWLEFMEPDAYANDPDEAERLKSRFEKIIERVIDEAVKARVIPDHDYDTHRVAYLAYGSLTGAGVGLWEDDDLAVLEKGVTRDKDLQALAQDIQYLAYAA